MECYYTNMTSLWGCQHDCLRRVSIVTLGLRPRVTGRYSYYTSREDTPILLDESHVSTLLATCVSVGSLTAGHHSTY